MSPAPDAGTGSATPQTAQQAGRQAGGTTQAISEGFAGPRIRLSQRSRRTGRAWRAVPVLDGRVYRVDTGISPVVHRPDNWAGYPQCTGNPVA